MKVSLNWLKEFVEINESAEEIAELITRAGVEIGGIEKTDCDISGVVVAEVVSCEDHPDSDHLHLCQVTIDGVERIQVVCGAPNVAKGQKVLFATVGAVLPGGFKIKKAKLRGVESFGMICGMTELGYAEDLLHADDKNGIRVLPEDAPLGMDGMEYLGRRDYILDLDLTPNRSDCLSVYGIALEVGAILNKPVKAIAPTIKNPLAAEDFVEVDIEDENLCPLYTATLVKNIKNGRSPIALEHRLQCAGIRPISLLVDITNYVMLETGQPLHGFDYQDLKAKKIVVRPAHEKETMVTLDDQERQLNPANLLICDGDKPVALAGVMGGADGEMSLGTTEVMIESAVFHAPSVRRTSTRLGLRSESSIRNEKGVNPEMTSVAAWRAAELMEKYAGGQVVTNQIEAGAMPEAIAPIELQLSKVNHVLGTVLKDEEIIEILERLHFTVERLGEKIKVQVPGHRRDVRIEEDLIEEVARLFGYDNIPSTLPQGKTAHGQLNPKQQLIRFVKRQLVGMGLREIATFGFTGKKHAELLRWEKEDSRRDSIAIANPLSEELEVMRTSLVPGLLNTFLSNERQQIPGLRIFELGSVFFKEEIFDEDHLAHEKTVLALGLYGKSAMHWQMGAKPYDFYDLKGIVEGLLEGLHLQNVKYVPLQEKNESWHPGRTADIYVGDVYLGRLGELHPLVSKGYGLKHDCYIAELDVNKLLELSRTSFKVEEVAKYPSNTRDMAIVVDENTDLAAVEEAIYAAQSKHLKDVLFFDLYRGDQLPEGQKSLAFALRFQSHEGTLTDEEVDKEFKAILESVKTRCDGELRQL